GDDVAKIGLRRVGLAFESLEALKEQIVVDPRPVGLVRRGHHGDPEAERPLGNSLPGLAAVIAANEVGAFLEESGIHLFPRPELAAGHGAAPGVRLDLILHPLSLPDRSSARAGTGTIL